MEEIRSLNSHTRRAFAKGFGFFTLAGLGGGLAIPTAAMSSAGPLTNPFIGRWRYRSFRNISEPVTKLDQIIFWEAELNITDGANAQVLGDIGDAQDKLTIKGSATFGFPNHIRFEANGIDGSGTAGWKYNYSGFLAPAWPDGIDQRDSIVGSVIRSVPHSNGQAKAGYVASFIAVRLN